MVAYRSVNPLDWAEDLEGKRIVRSIPRRAGGVTLVTIEVEGGRLFDLMIGERSCEHCGQVAMVPNFFVPSRPERVAPPLARTVPIESYARDPEARGAVPEDEEVEEPPEDLDAALEERDAGGSGDSSSKRTITRAELEKKLQSMSLDEVMQYLQNPEEVVE